MHLRDVSSVHPRDVSSMHPRALFGVGDDFVC